MQLEQITPSSTLCTQSLSRSFLRIRNSPEQSMSSVAWVVLQTGNRNFLILARKTAAGNLAVGGAMISIATSAIPMTVGTRTWQQLCKQVLASQGLQSRCEGMFSKLSHDGQRWEQCPGTIFFTVVPCLLTTTQSVSCV